MDTFPSAEFKLLRMQIRCRGNGLGQSEKKHGTGIISNQPNYIFVHQLYPIRSVGNRILKVCQCSCMG